MTWAHTPDGGATIDDRRPDQPTKVWVQDTDDPPTGHYEPTPTYDLANDYGWWEIRQVPRPAGHIRATPPWAIVAGMLEPQWVFDQATQDAEDAEAADEVERQTIRDLLPDIVTQIDDCTQIIADMPGSNDAARRQAIAELARGQRLAMRSLRRLIRDTFGP